MKTNSLEDENISWLFEELDVPGIREYFPKPFTFMYAWGFRKSQNYPFFLKESYLIITIKRGFDPPMDGLE